MKTQKQINKEKRPSKPKHRKIARHNWDLLKIKYLASPISPVTEFFRSEGYDDKFLASGVYSTRTSGWFPEKQALYKKIIEENKKQTLENLEVDTVELTRSKQTALLMIQAVLQQGVQTRKDGTITEVKLSVKEIANILRIIKTELGEATDISKQYNVDLSKVKEKQKQLISGLYDKVETLENRKHTPKPKATK